MLNLTDLEGVGPVRAESLRAMGIGSLRDLFFTLPVRYEDHETVFPCAAKTEGTILVQGSFHEPLKSSYFHGISRVNGTISDSSGKLPVCWYNEPWITQQISPESEIRLYGRMTVRNGRRVLQNPQIVRDSGWIPVYRSVKHFPAKSFRKLMTEALEHLDECCPETLPAAFRLQHQLCELNFAIREAHFPANQKNLEAARRRLSFEQVLLYLLYVSFSGSTRHAAHPMKIDAGMTDRYWGYLPFEATAAQKKVLMEIAEDLQKPTAMARLVQGDVGSGKTAVAFGAAWLAWSAGFQVSMMAPTEILAVQHYEAARKTLTPLGINCRLLTGSTKAKERRAILEELADGNCHALFGTHALISRDVQYQKLGLVITDEQHRFGVHQRDALHQKGETESHLFPHVLVMTATPIPRSLALILYGDLDISVIDELPKGRVPVRTRLVPEEKRQAMYQFLRSQVQQGKQAYIVCPSVEESENADELRSVKAVYDQLRQHELHDLRIGLTWGKQKSSDKESILRDFVNGSYDVLVATTMIEVGINNPNATIMIIENADRFGLSQLHQLRGRVGRGSSESWCFLLSESSEKLRILCMSNDGFVISRKDLEFRGPGDLAGTRQSGDPAGNILSGCDARLLEEVSTAVRQLYRDPGQQETLSCLNNYARSYFENAVCRISLN